jgi:hypothetical protein
MCRSLVKDPLDSTGAENVGFAKPADIVAAMARTLVGP